MRRSSRWLVILPALWFALTPQSAKADPQPGLNAVGYTINQINPTRSDSLYPTCGSELENNINRNFNGEPFQDCGWDFYMVHYTGFITIPENTSVRFMVAADDGGTVNIGGYNMGTWNLKGCSWSQQINPPLSGGTYPLDGWFYEWTGGSCYMLAWQLDDGDWEIVPEWAFTTTSTPATTTTTTTVPSTTVPVTDPPTTTTVQETTTSTATTTTTSEPPTTTSTISTTTTTTEPETTTTSSTTTTTTSTTTTSTTTTTTEVPWVPPPTVHTLPPTTSTTPTTEVPEPSTTTEPATTTTESTVATTLPPRPSTTIPSTTSTLPPTTTIAPTTTVSPTTTVPVPETREEVVALVTSAAALSSLPVEEAKQVFAELDVTELDNTEKQEIIAAVQEAPTEVRQAFEEKVDLFKAGFDDYVPLGSNIPIGTRRTLIAVTAGITLAAAGTRMRR